MSFKTLDNFHSEELVMWNLTDNAVHESWVKDYRTDLWNGHDYKNLIAFKNNEAWIKFCYALKHLVEFFNKMEENDDQFKIFFKSYTTDNLTDLNKECCNFIIENYWDDILEFANKGYVLMYFTNQRECHDKNHFITYMLDNWMYDRIMRGHRCLETDEIKDIEFIVLNEK